MTFRFFALSLFTAAMILGSGALSTGHALAKGVTIIAAASLPPLENLGRGCVNVVDFGADPTGSSPATGAFQRAFQSASLQNGIAVCAPAGTFQITNSILLYSGASIGSQGGPSFYGAGPGLTVLKVTMSGNVFDSCPSYSDVTPTMGYPSACPPLTPFHTASPSPNPNSGLYGTVFSNFSIQHTGGTPASDFYFPEIQSLLVDNVCVTNSVNVFDLGDLKMEFAAGPIVIRDSTCGFSFSGHFIAVHGAIGGLTVVNNLIEANGSGLVFDTSDMSNGGNPGSAGNMSWVDNDIEQPSFGMFLFVGQQAVSGLNGPGVQDSQWRGNIYNGCVFLCYYFAAEENSALPRPDFGHITVADRSATSLYDSILMNGGFYTAAGVEGIQIGGPSYYAGSTGTAVTASSLLMLAGSPAPGTGAIAISYAGGYKLYGITSTQTAGAVAAGLAAAPAVGTAFAASEAVPLANPHYAIIGSSLAAAPAPGSYTASPYQVIVNSSGLNVLGVTPAAAMCTMPPSSTTSYPCYDLAFDNGDGISVRNLSHDIDIVGSHIVSPSGAAIHVWPLGGDILHIFSNVLGQGYASSTYTGIQIDVAATPTPLADYYISGNDVVGATNGIVNLAPAPAFTIVPGLPAMRSQRGAAGVAVNLTIATLPLVITNPGPLDCTYYFDWSGSGGLATLTLQLPGPAGAASLGVSQPPAQVALPVGSQLSASTAATGVVSYAALCRP